MPRLPNETIERIKHEVSLLDVVTRQGYTIQTQGKDKVVLCPFHDENTPSCIISPKTNLFHCFGCGTGGSVIDWVMKTENMTFRAACDSLLKDIDITPNSPTNYFDVDKKSDAEIAQATQKKSSSHSLLVADNQTKLREVIDYYHDTLLYSQTALDYLQSRGLNHPELIKTFKLGYANKTLGNLLPKRNTKQGEVMRTQLQQIGILRESGHEHFNGSLVVPVMNEAGIITEVYGRKTLGNQLKKTIPQHLYLLGPHQGVWNTQGLQNQSEIILCEALIDAMSFWVNGFRNVTASYGTQGFTEEHLVILKSAGVKRVLIAYDNDDSGNKAAKKLAEKLKDTFACYRLTFPKNMDANSYALQVQPAQKSLGLVIQQATYLGSGEPPERASNVSNMIAEQASAIANTHDREHKENAASETAKATLNEPGDQSKTDPVKASSLAAKSSQVPIGEMTKGEHHFTFGNRAYRVRGLSKNKTLESLKVNLLVRDDAGLLHVDTLDLYAAKVRQLFIKNAAIELGMSENIIKQDVGQVLMQCEALQSQLLEEKTEDNAVAPMTAEEETSALELLRSPDLLTRIVSDIGACGMVGEDTNALVAYLAATSRKLAKPLAIIIQSTSAAGKSALMDAVLALLPETERVQYSAMTGQSLFYMGQTNLKHKVLAIAEEEGASNASYALKLLQSDGQVTIASTGKDNDTGELVTKEYTVEGPVMLLMTTTAIDIDEELMNRCVVLTVNESREQTQRIHAAQRQKRTLSGLQASLQKESLTQLHRHAQQLLRPLAVVNPYADKLTFLDDKTRTRRDHEKYLTLIDSLALLHQYQRPVKTIKHNGSVIDYVEVHVSDIDTANRLAHEVLGRTLDELPAQTRKLLNLIQTMVQQECEQEQIEQKDYRFSRRDIRTFTGWSDNQLKVHCARLSELEYLLVHSGHRGKQLNYELLYDNTHNDNHAHLMGLIDSTSLQSVTLQNKPQKQQYDHNKLEGVETKLVPSCAQVGAKLDEVTSPKTMNGMALTESSLVAHENALQG